MIERDAREMLCSTVCTVCTLTAPNAIKKKQQQCKERRRQKEALAQRINGATTLSRFHKVVPHRTHREEQSLCFEKCATRTWRSEYGWKNACDRNWHPNFRVLLPDEKKNTQSISIALKRGFSFFLSRESNEIVFSWDGKYSNFGE